MNVHQRLWLELELDLFDQGCRKKLLPTVSKSQAWSDLTGRSVRHPPAASPQMFTTLPPPMP